MRDLQHDATGLNPAFGVVQYSPDQVFMRTNMTGRNGIWLSDGGEKAIHTAHSVTQHPDGTVDVVRLEGTFDGWQDLGGSMAPDVQVGRF